MPSGAAGKPWPWNVLTRFTGILCHNHWKPCFQLNCLHALCNVHHLRELTYVEEQDQEVWAKQMRELLLDIEQAVKTQDSALPEPQAISYIEQYRALFKQAELEYPPFEHAAKNQVNAGRINTVKREIYWSDY